MNNLYKCPICGEPTNYSSIQYQKQPCAKCNSASVNHIPGNVFVADAGLPKGAEAPAVATTPAPTSRADKECYWHGQYQLMRERYYKQMGENSQQAQRIHELEEQRKVMGFLLNEAMKELETEQAEKRELYAMLSHIVDWSPELPFYMKDEHKTLFRNALAAARELLSKCKVKEGK